LFNELFSSYTQLILRYERSSILDGELWRLLSAYLVHGGWEHLWLNIIALSKRSTIITSNKISLKQEFGVWITLCIPLWLSSGQGLINRE